MKDKFSHIARDYASFRPTYPAALYDFIISHCTQKESAWDCGTGNGQVAKQLSQYFNLIYATDLSPQQVEYAFSKENIIYKVEAAEHCTFPDQSFDLITVAQAIHWFDFDRFYQQVNRTLKPQACIAVFGYGLIRVNEPVDQIISEMYFDTFKSYWDMERKYIDEEYRTIPFPFEELPSPQFAIELDWRLPQLIGYLNTWSAMSNYRNTNHADPLGEYYYKIRQVWGENELKKIQFPVFLRMGKLK